MLELPVHITSLAEYRYAVSRAYEPLQDYKRFALPIALRIEIQRQLFGHSYISKGNVVAANDRFYHFCWDKKKHYCEECLAPLRGYSSKFISHIISRGARPDMAHDPRNVNILCYRHHTQWETGARVEMRIYRQNQLIIEILKTDYATVK